MRAKFPLLFVYFFLLFHSSLSFDFDNIDIKGVVYNPYRVFNLPPWSSMKTIKKRYKELIKKYHPDKSHENTQKQFQLIQTSFEKIKKIRKNHENGDEELSFSCVLRELISSIIKVVLLFMVLYVVTFLIYKLQLLFVVPAAFQILSFVLTDNLIPHLFPDQSMEFLFACAFGLAMYAVYSVGRRRKGKEEKRE